MNLQVSRDVLILLQWYPIPVGACMVLEWAYKIAAKKSPSASYHQGKAFVFGLWIAMPLAINFFFDILKIT